MNANQQIKPHKPTWQVVIFGACSMVLSLSSAAYSHGLSRPASSSVSYPQNYALMHTSHNLPSSEQKSRQLASADGLMQAATRLQPSVYHSIIDRTDDPSNLAISPAVQTSTSTTGDLNTAAGHHHGHAHGKYYEYRAVPKKKTWKFGYKRGNHKHTISRHEHGKAGKHPHFKTKVKWHDKKSKGKGIHLWDYNHHDKKHYHHG